MKVLILVGSAKRGSRSLALGRAIESSLKDDNADVELIDLIEYQLPMFSVDVDYHKSYDEKTKAFIGKTHWADAYVWVTPVYHNLFSAILKNALDWQHFSLKDKVVGLASNGNNRSSVAIDRLMFVARAQHLITIPTRICTARDDYDEQLKVTNADIQNRIGDFSKELVDITKKIRG